MSSVCEGALQTCLRMIEMLLDLVCILLIVFDLVISEPAAAGQINMSVEECEL